MKIILNFHDSINDVKFKLKFIAEYLLITILQCFTRFAAQVNQDGALSDEVLAQADAASGVATTRDSFMSSGDSLVRASDSSSGNNLHPFVTADSPSGSDVAEGATRPGELRSASDQSPHSSPTHGSSPTNSRARSLSPAGSPSRSPRRKSSPRSRMVHIADGDMDGSGDFPAPTEQPSPVRRRSRNSSPGRSGSGNPFVTTSPGNPFAASSPTASPVIVTAVRDGSPPPSPALSTASSASRQTSPGNPFANTAAVSGQAAVEVAAVDAYARALTNSPKTPFPNVEKK